MTIAEYGIHLPTNSTRLWFYPIEENSELPEENNIVLWWWKGPGQPPYIGSMCDSDFPGIDKFFTWCECPNPNPYFVNKFNHD